MPVSLAALIGNMPDIRGTIIQWEASGMAFVEDTTLVATLLVAFACGIPLSHALACRFFFPRSFANRDIAATWPDRSASLNPTTETQPKSDQCAKLLQFPQTSHGVRDTLGVKSSVLIPLRGPASLSRAS